MTRMLVIGAWLWLFSAELACAQSFALIVTNNRSLSSSRPDLHYADDDGVQYAELFAELLGPEHVTLLTQPDAETRALHPAAQPQPPTAANLHLAVARLRAQLVQAQSEGKHAQVYLVFAGHGDIEAGQGYLDLADARLSARALDEDVLAQLPAERIHLILDSCNSYFLLNPRKPGGKRWDSRQNAPRNLLAKYPHLGALLSTSAEAVTYEWSEIQSGVFSYEVRSGLRGGADVDADGRITYAEMAAFIHVANRPVINDLYRPKVFSSAPRLDKHSERAVLAQLPAASGRSLLLRGEQSLRLTLRDAQGVRLLDVHTEAGTALTLKLPAEIALTAEQRLDGADRPSYIEPLDPDRLAALGGTPRSSDRARPTRRVAAVPQPICPTVRKERVGGGAPRARSPRLAF